MIAEIGPDDKVVRHHTLPYHGAKTPIPHGILRDLVRKFDLPEDIFD